MRPRIDQCLGIHLRRIAALTIAVLATVPNNAIAQTSLPDGLYAAIHTNKGKVLARLEHELTPMTVANFVGLAEGTIENAAFGHGRPYFDGTTYHRVVPGHVIQTGVPRSHRSNGPGYTFPNEIHARLSHDHAGALNMANSGPHTNGSQFCITLGDRSYLDGDYTVFGEVLEGMAVVMSIEQGDVVDSVRIVRVGSKAESFRATTESFRDMVRVAEQRVAEHAEKKRLAEESWIAANWPNAAGPAGGLRSVQLSAAATLASTAGPLHVRYRGTRLRYMGHRIDHVGPELEVTTFGSGENGVPGFAEPPVAFLFESGKTTVNQGVDAAIAEMRPGERRIVVVPAELAYGRNGLYTAETPGQPRFVISPNTVLVYDIEILPHEKQERPPGSDHSGPAFTFHKVHEDIYHAVGTGALAVGANAAVIINQDDVLLVDSHVSPAAATALLDELRQVTTKPVRYVVNTHFHFDHVHGNQIYPETVEIIGHEFTREKIAAGGSISGRAYERFTNNLPQQIATLKARLDTTHAADQRAALERQIKIQENYKLAVEAVRPRAPNVALSERLTLHRGGREIRLEFLGRGHTGGDVVVYLPAERVLVTGDLLPAALPYMGDGYVPEWIDTLEKLKALDFDVILPGHGQPYTDKNRIDNLQAYLADFWTQVIELQRAGVTAQDAARRIDMRLHASNYPSITAPGVDLDAVLAAYEVLTAAKPQP